MSSDSILTTTEEPEMCQTFEYAVVLVVERYRQYKSVIKFKLINIVVSQQYSNRDATSVNFNSSENVKYLQVPAS